MTAPLTPTSEPSVGGSAVGTLPEPGRFDRLPLIVTLVVRPDDDPLPEVCLGGTHGTIPLLRFEDARASLKILLSGSARSQAAWLGALGAELSSLARAVEDGAR